MEMEWVSRILQVILMALLPLALGALTSWLLALARVQAGKLNDQQLNILMTLAQMAVKAAEQARLAGYITDKKKYAFDTLEKWFLKHGLTVDVDSLDAAIEAAVLDAFGPARGQP